MAQVKNKSYDDILAYRIIAFSLRDRDEHLALVKVNYHLVEFVLGLGSLSGRGNVTQL
jgi:hypothetical protein